MSTPLARAFAATATADLARAHGKNDPDLWRVSIEAWSDVPYFEAKAEWRLAQALIEHDPTDLEAVTLLDEAEATAVDSRRSRFSKPSKRRDKLPPGSSPPGADSPGCCGERHSRVCSPMTKRSSILATSVAVLA